MYYSHGKILLTAEYLVLYGARALAMPVKYGQTLEQFQLPHSRELHWQATVTDTFWFSAEYMLPDLYIKATSDKEVANTLRDLLLAARSLNPRFLSEDRGYLVRTSISFNRLWGLGTSSSLISNVAYWSDTDPYRLHALVSQGSGFDIACARASGPLFYQLDNGMPVVTPVDFRPSFRKNLYFVYLGRKQNSEKSLRVFREKHPRLAPHIEEVSALTRRFAEAETLEKLDEVIREHEALLSPILGLPTLKERCFPDLDGEVKSLGAWGGDFALLTWKGQEKDLFKYLRSKDIFTFFGFNEMSL